MAQHSGLPQFINRLGINELVNRTLCSDTGIVTVNANLVVNGTITSNDETSYTCTYPSSSTGNSVHITVNDGLRTSDSLNSAYPNSQVGTMVVNQSSEIAEDSNVVLYIKLNEKQWAVTSMVLLP
jgi:hypothetical protein